MLICPTVASFYGFSHSSSKTGNSASLCGFSYSSGSSLIFNKLSRTDSVSITCYFATLSKPVWLSYMAAVLRIWDLMSVGRAPTDMERYSFIIWLRLSLILRFRAVTAVSAAMDPLSLVVPAG